VLVESLGNLGGYPGKCQAEQHFDGKTVGGSIEIGEGEPVDGFAKTKGSEYHSQPNQCKGQAVKRSKFQRWLILATALLD
jgi:hypothetical protein